MSAFGNGLAFGFMQGMMFNSMFWGFRGPFFGGFMPFGCFPCFSMPIFNFCNPYTSFPIYNDNLNSCNDQLLFNFTPTVYQPENNCYGSGWDFNDYSFDTFLRTQPYNTSETTVPYKEETQLNSTSTAVEEVEILPPNSGAEAIIEQIEQEQAQQSQKTTNPAVTGRSKEDWTKMTDEEMRAVYGNYTRDITVPYSGTAEQLNKYLEKEGVLAGKGEAFMKAQKDYGISASVLAAICINESKHGTSNLAKTKNNVCGLRIPGSKDFIPFNSVEACIDDMGRRLKSYYVDNSRSLTKLYQVNAKYCPIQDTTDKTGGNNGWARAVDKITKQIEEAAKK